MASTAESCADCLAQGDVVLETLSWERLEGHIGKNAPILLSMGGTRGVSIGFDPVVRRLFLRLPLEKNAKVPASPYAELDLEARQQGSITVLEIFTTADHLFRDFHRLAGLLAEDFERPGQTAVGAFLAVVERWRELTTKRSLLSPEEQLGLVGELVVLNALISKHGPVALSSWTGRAKDMPERHDFRIGAIDVEVKSTRGSQRQHVVHGLRQMEPSKGHDLFLVSLRFEAAGMGNGSGLSERVQAVRRILSVNHLALEEFEAKLAAARFRTSDMAHYQERLILADTPMLIPVDTSFPRLVPSMVSKAMGPALASRIDNDVVYRVNVEGLGTPLSASAHAHLFGPIAGELT